jgi:uncharacterized protein (TIGR02300 family)
MGRPELGHKFACVGCGARFYDLNRTPAICPKCEVQQPPEKPRVVRPSGASASAGRRTTWRAPVAAVRDEPEPVESAEDAEEEEAEDDVAADEDVNDVDELPDIGEGAV